jgi:hypothetical protein
LRIWSKSKTRPRDAESHVVLDLEEVDLIDLEGVRFLNAGEAKGIAVLHCSLYIVIGACFPLGFR